MDRKCCMDASTTSPAESMNNSLKHKSSKANSRVNLDNAMHKIISGITNRLKRRRNQACRELDQNNMASRATEKDFLISKGQGLTDRNFDSSNTMKSARLGYNEFIVWDFDLVDMEKIDAEDSLYDVQLAIPCFLRVRELHIDVQSDGKIFVPCTCGERTKTGIPCQCFWQIAKISTIPHQKIMTEGMFDIRWFKIFNSHFGSDEDEDAEILKCFTMHTMSVSNPKVKVHKLQRST